ncbi:MAG: hypothetical protein ACOC6G_00700 [Thermoproteota archaeon]
MSKELFSSIHGEETDFSKYEMPLEKHWHLSKFETFRIWILYSIKEDNLKTKDELIRSLEITFQPGYIPIMSDLRFNLGEGFNFGEEFDTLIEPLLDEEYLIKKEDKFVLTPEGEERVEGVLSRTRYHQTK